MITGLTRTYSQSIREINKVIRPKEGQTPFGIHVLVGQSHTIFMPDTTVNERPTAEKPAAIAEGTADVARRMGHKHRVDFLSSSPFANLEGTWLDNISDAIKFPGESEVRF